MGISMGVDLRDANKYYEQQHSLPAVSPGEEKTRLRGVSFAANQAGRTSAIEW